MSNLFFCVLLLFFLGLGVPTLIRALSHVPPYQNFVSNDVHPVTQPLPPSLTLPSFPQAVWNEKDVFWASHFEVLPQSSLIVFIPSAGVYNTVPGMRGLKVIKPLPLNFCTPSMRGDIRLSTDRPLLKSLGHDRFVSYMTRGRVLDSFPLVQVGLCPSSCVNSISNAYIGQISISTGHPTPDPSWTKAVAHVRLVNPSKDATCRYRSSSGKNKPPHRHPLLHEEILCSGYGTQYPLQRAPALTVARSHPVPAVAECPFSVIPILSAPPMSSQSLAQSIALSSIGLSSLDELPSRTQSAWCTWCEFVAWHNASASFRLDEFLLEVSSLDANTAVASFIYTLIDYFTYSTPAALSLISRLQKAFSARGRPFPTSFSAHQNPLLNGVLAKAKSDSPSSDRQGVIAYLAAEKLPISLEMLEWMYATYWVPGLWTHTNSIDMRALVLINFLGVVLGCRTSNLLIGDLVSRRGSRVRLDHWLRGEDISFTLKQDSSLPDIIVRGGANSLRIALDIPLQANCLDAIDSSVLSRVQSAAIVLLTSKPTAGSSMPTRANAARPKIISRTGFHEARVLNCLCLFELARGAIDPSEPFFSRADPLSASTKSLREKEATAMLREAAIASGFEPNRFSSKCRRITMASVSASANIDSSVVNQLGGWTNSSRLHHTTYNRAPVTINTASLFDRAVATSSAVVHPSSNL